MDRREFLKATGAAALWLALGGCGGSPPAARRPNVVLFMADDLGYEVLGAYGGRSFATPALDTLAAGGLRFDHCTSEPLCTPTRVELLTGLYNHRNYEAFGMMPPGQTTFAHLLREAGYATCVVGKWQLFGSDREDPAVIGRGTRPGEAGFDEHCVWQVERVGPRYWDPLLVRNGEEAGGLEGRYGPDVVSGYGVDFIRRHRGGPFLLYYPMILPHAPFGPTPTRDDRDAWDGDSDPERYADHLAYLDEIVGRVVAALDEEGIREDTLVVITGDNGTPGEITSAVGDTAVRGGKGTTRDAGVHVPLIANWPGTVTPGSTDALVDFTDFLPTLTDLAGASAPAGADGRSLAPLLLGEPFVPREWVFVWFLPREGGPPVWFAADHRWKLYGDGSLFDVPADPLEEHPVPPGSSPAADEARRRLQAAADSLW